MAQFNPKEVVFCGDRRQYYVYDEELYTGTFPIEWAETHLPGTGPKECKKCATIGSWNGVFIGYCTECAEKHNFARGSGLKTYGGIGQYNVNIFETYLRGIPLDKIGDKDFIDTALAYADEIDKYMFSLPIYPIYDEAVDLSDEDDEECVSNKESISETIASEINEKIAKSKELYPEIDWDELNAYIDTDPCYEGDNEIGCGYGYGSCYDGGYDSY
jgi:hypothetical protein